VKAISKDINTNFGLGKCARVCLKKGSTVEKDIKELDPKEACKYLGREESHDTENKNEKESLRRNT